MISLLLKSAVDKKIKGMVNNNEDRDVTKE